MYRKSPTWAARAVATVAIVFSVTLPSRGFAVAFLADVTLSPVKTVLEIILSPFATTFAVSLASSDSPTDREAIMNTVVVDAADHLQGGDATPLLKEVHGLLRQEFTRRGEIRAYSDKDLSRMIAAEIGGSGLNAN